MVGSVAFSAVARVVLAAAKCKADDGSERRIIARAKSNLGPDDGGFEYAIEQCDLDKYPGISASRVAWGAAIEGTARELLAQAEDAVEAGGPGDAAAWLRDLLSTGAVGAREVKRHADEAGFAWRTVQRAMPKAGAMSRRVGFGGGTEWFLATNRATVAPIAPVLDGGGNGAIDGAIDVDTGIV